MHLSNRGVCWTTEPRNDAEPRFARCGKPTLIGIYEGRGRRDHVQIIAEDTFEASAYLPIRGSNSSGVQCIMTGFAAVWAPLSG